MPSRFTFRFISKASAATLKEIITLYRVQGWWNRRDKPELLPRIIKGSHCFVIAERKGRVIGMGRAISDGAGDAYIQDVTVLKSERGTGAGSAIVKAITRRLKADGIKWIGLIAQDNSSAFYARLGFKFIKHARPMLSKGSNV